MAFHLILAAAILPPPLPELQGDWWIVETTHREPGEEKPVLWWYAGGLQTWSIQGRRIDGSGDQRQYIDWVEQYPRRELAGGPNAIRLKRFNGEVYIGTYQFEDGKLKLNLRATVPIKGKPNETGTKYLTAVLERPKPPPAPRVLPRPPMDP